MFNNYPYEDTTGINRVATEVDFFDLKTKLTNPPSANAGFKKKKKHSWGRAVIWPKLKNFKPNWQKNLKWLKIKSRPLISYSNHRYAKLFSNNCKALNFLNKEFAGQRNTSDIKTVIRAVHKFNQKWKRYKKKFPQKFRKKVFHCFLRDISNFFTAVPRTKMISAIKESIQKIKDRSRHKYIVITNKFTAMKPNAKFKIEPNDGRFRYGKNIRDRPHAYLSSHKVHPSVGECVHIDDIEIISKWDLKFNHIFIGDNIKRQIEGTPMGSPNGPGFACSFGSKIENERFKKDSNNMKDKIELRWIDDLILGGFNLHKEKTLVNSHIHPKSYGIECELEPGDTNLFVGLKFRTNDDNVLLCNAFNPNFEEIAFNLRLKIPRFAHGLSSLTKQQKAGLITGQIIRTIDSAYGDLDRLHDDILVLINEFVLLKYPRKLIIAQLHKIDIQWKHLQIKKVIQSFNNDIKIQCESLRKRVIDDKKYDIKTTKYEESFFN